PPRAADEAQESIFDAWGGVSGGQTPLPIVVGEAAARGLDPDVLVRLLAGAPAQRLRLGRKGRLELGADADLALVERRPWRLTSHDPWDPWRLSPFVGPRIGAPVGRTIVPGPTPWARPRAGLSPPPPPRPSPG